MTDFQWSPEQLVVRDECARWLDDPDGEQIRALYGYAGTGKTSLAKDLVRGRRVRFCAYTGKAASVLRAMGCDDATTIHSLIYKPHEETVRGNDGRMTRETRYVRQPDALEGVDVIVADECSMLSPQVLADLLAYDVKILFLGDPFQLPPVDGSAGALGDMRPSWMLTRVHRHGGEILQLATDIREGRWDGSPRAGEQCQVLPWRSVGGQAPMLLNWADVVIVGTNNSRHKINSWVRQNAGIRSPWPRAQEKLVCLRNDHRRGLANGQQWLTYANSEVLPGEPGCGLAIEDPDTGSQMLVDAHGHHFLGRESELKDMHMRFRRARAEFDYGYAMTCHKSQGSAWPRVLVLDESRFFGDDAAKWLYTACSRSAKELIVLVPNAD